MALPTVQNGLYVTVALYMDSQAEPPIATSRPKSSSRRVIAVSS